MYRQTLAKIKLLSNILPDPNRADKAMRSLLLCSVKVCKKTLTRNVISMMIRNNVCTNDVNSCIKILCKREDCKRRKNKLKQFLMNDKLQDAEYEIKSARREFSDSIKEYYKFVQKNSAIDKIYTLIKDHENKLVWEEGKIRNNKKLNNLIKKQRVIRVEDETSIRGIIFRDRDISNMFTEANNRDNTPSTGGNEPRLYGGAEVSGQAINVLRKDPNFMILDKIDIDEIGVAAELGFTKARYGWMNDDQTGAETIEGGVGTSNNAQDGVQGNDDKTLNYANLRATDIPTVQRLYRPSPGTLKQEKTLEKLRDILLKTVQEYKAENCNDKGEFIKNNFSKEENQGLKEIKEKIKKKEIVVFSTDKSGRFSVDTPSNYEEAVKVHTNKDEEIDHDRVRSIETTVNHHMRHFNRMFNVGSTHGHEDRVTAATLSTHTPPPPLYGLRKDHKVTVDAEKGPPVRPVCGANQAPNSRLSGFLSRIVNDYADKENIGTECRSGEEMKAAFEKYNETDGDVKTQCAIISMDVRALYPSMEWHEIGLAVRDMIENSEHEIENVDWVEVGKYLAVTMEEDQIIKEGLRNVIPKRKEETNRKIGIAYLNNKQNDDKWANARSPGCRQKKKMLGIAVAEGVRTCMANHVYCMGDKVYLQKEGGPIGLELTGAVSRPFMARWDRMYMEKVRQAGGELMLYERYVDDSNQIGKVPPVGARYDKETKKIVIDQEEGEPEREPDERLAKVLLDIANDVMECIQMEADWPTKNDDKRLPILDMKVWTGEEGDVMYTHYEKPVCSKTVLNSMSAHSSSCKRSVHIQEVLRRLLNCSKRLKWEDEAVPAVNEYMRRLKAAGYSERYRRNILKQAMSIHDEKWMDQQKGVRPVYRAKDYKKEERKREKEKKKNNWSKKGGGLAPIFIPATPRSELLKRVRQAAKETEKDGIKFTYIEMGGRTIKRELQRSNPTATPGCDLPDCACCKDGRGKGGPCHRNNVNYVVTCKLCPEGREAIYIGESARNLYIRMKEHLSNKGEGSFICKHLDEKHQGMVGNFEARVTKTNRDCLTRQVREGVQILQQGHKHPLMNTKSEWHQPSLYTIQSEIVS